MVSKICSVFLLVAAFLNQEMLTSAQYVSAVCSESIETGRCRAYFRRYAYDSTEKRCVNFVYGGCGGNGNNFQNLNECLSACKPDCLQPLKVGKCRASEIRYGYSSKLENCVQFIYGGCDKNANNFETFEECQTQCG